MEKRSGYLRIFDGVYVDVEFVINEERGCVAAVAKNCSELALAAIDSDKYFRSVSYIEIQDGSKLSKDMKLNDSYSAVARCIAPDVFDVDYGIQIAFVKLFNKLNRAVYSRKCILAKEMLRIADRLILRS